MVEIDGFRILISGDSYQYQEIANDYKKLDAVFWHIYKPSDLFDLQALQRLFSPVYIVPYHLNIKYGLSTQGMAALTDRYRFQGVNPVYLTKDAPSLVLEQNPARPPPIPASGPASIQLNLEVDRFFRGLQPPGTVQLVASIRHNRPDHLGGDISIVAPDGWKATALDSPLIPRLDPGRVFLCRFIVKARGTLAPTPRDEFLVTATLKTGDQTVSQALRFGGGQIYNWNLLGPFDNADGEGDKRTYAPEEVIDLQRIYTGRDQAPLRWIPYASRDIHSSYIDMAGVFDVRETYAPQLAVTNPKSIRNMERLVGYAMIYVDSPSDRDVLFNAGAPYGLQLFVNGKPVFKMSDFSFNFSPGQFAVPAKLTKGRNLVLVKIARGRLPELNLSPWTGFCLSLTDSQQRPFQDLVFALK